MLCYVCNLFVDKNHDCEKAKEMVRNREAAEASGTVKNDGPWIAMKARPTRTMA